MSTGIPDNRRRGRQAEGEEAAVWPARPLQRHEQPFSLRHEQPFSLRPVQPVLAPENDSVRDALRAVRRSWWIILLAAVAATAVGVGLAQIKPKRYQAAVYMLLNGNNYQAAVGGGYNPADPQQQLATLNSLMTPKLLVAAAHKAGLVPTSFFSVNAEAASSSTVANLVATTSTSGTAPALANAVAASVRQLWQRSNASQLQEAKRLLGQQITEARNLTFRRTLVGEVNNLNDLNALANQQFQVIERASGQGALVPRNTLRTGVLALVLGVLLGGAIALLRKRKPRLS